MGRRRAHQMKKLQRDCNNLSSISQPAWNEMLANWKGEGKKCTKMKLHFTCKLNFIVFSPLEHRIICGWPESASNTNMKSCLNINLMVVQQLISFSEIQRFNGEFNDLKMAWWFLMNIICLNSTDFYRRHQRCNWLISETRCMSVWRSTPDHALF